MYALRILNYRPGMQTMPNRYKSVTMARAMAERISYIERSVVDILDDSGRVVETVTMEQ